MSDIVRDAVTETGFVFNELVVKAAEARAAGESRRSFFGRTAKIAASTALGAAGAGLLQQAAAKASTTLPSQDTVQDIVNIAATAECLAITFYNLALESKSLPDVNNAANQNYFQAAITQEADHLLFLHQQGGVPLATKFYFPEGMFTNERVFFPTALTLEETFISAYIAAALDFSGVYSSAITTPSAYYVGAMVQIAGVECEHRALLGVAANVTPPNNVVIETASLTTVEGAVGPLTPFLNGGPGFVGPFNVPSRSVIEAAAGPYGFSFFPKYTFV